MAKIYPIEENTDESKLEVFFDYVCPYCNRGNKNLQELMTKYPKLDIIWRPCEAHPRPEKHGVHSDLAICGFYFLVEHDGDLIKYNNMTFAATFEENKNVEDIAVLSDIADKCGVSANEFTKVLKEGKYQDLVKKGNAYAWDEKQFMAVPSYARGRKKIGSANGVMVTKEQLEKFISE